MLSHRFNFGKPGEIASSFRSGLEIMEREGFVAHSTYDSGFVSQSFGRALSLVHVSDKSAEAQAVRRGASSVEALEQTVGNREPKPKNIQFTSQDVGKVTHRDRTEIASEMLQSWAQSSSSGAGLSMSRAAEEIFGKRSSSYAKYDGEYDPLNVRQRLELEVSKAVVKAMYADTQETLSAAGITSMVVHRGYVAQSKDSSPHPVRTRLEQSADGIVPVVGEQRPLSSWSTDIYLAADQFGENKQGTTTGLDRRVDAQIVATRIVAAKDIVALPTTGIGAARESEVVILTRERGSRGFDWAQETTDLTQPGSTMFKVGIEILGERLGLSKEQTKQIKEGAISF
jgi:hypothetical protein